MVRLVVLLAAAGRAGEHFLKTRLRLPLPAADLVRMYFVLGRDRLDRAVPAQRFGRYLGFELRCESASFRRHPLGPPHGLVYTLTSCPFFRDHLKKQVYCGYYRVVSCIEGSHEHATYTPAERISPPR